MTREQAITKLNNLNIASFAELRAMNNHTIFNMIDWLKARGFIPEDVKTKARKSVKA